MKIISLNVEGQKHLSRVREFLVRENADVVCLQEYFPETRENLLSDYPYYFFVPTYKVDQDQNGLKHSATRVWGELIASKVAFKHTEVRRVTMDDYGSEYLPSYPQDNHLPSLLVVELVNDMKVATIHFTWTPNGTVTLRQNRHIKELLEMTKAEELIICGDFNIPRGNEMYHELRKVWQDNIPEKIESTIDPKLHYANKKQEGKLKLVVDYAWSTPKYQVRDVRVECGISDHCAVIAEVLRSR